jgi:hypothetical protein
MVGVFLLEVPLYGKSALPFRSSTVKWLWLVECAAEQQMNEISNSLKVSIIIEIHLTFIVTCSKYFPDNDENSI